MIAMTEAGFRGITVRKSTWDELEELRKNLGLRSVAEAVAHVTAEHPKRCSLLAARKEAMIAPEAT